MKAILAAIFLVVVAGSATAQSNRPGVGIFPTFQVIVTPEEGGVYRVEPVGISSAPVYWCGIGDYAVQTLGKARTQRIYIAEAYVPGARTVKFSFDPPADIDTTPGYSLTVNRVGENLSASRAENLCYDSVIDFRRKK
ncbi:hypothetical protein [Ruegeria lacuscaerulensis]|uniref:hypothetical protein n=1 Tax=Ruegeria lacuscaerulensis TaxID=55218 RepID=UPI00147C9B67